jgi:uncharacterized protein with HEPN domain
MREAIGDSQRLHHIIEAIKEIEIYTKEAAFEQFCANSMMRFASIKQIEIIGEAVYHISGELKKKHSGIEWEQIAGMRHILVHEYFGIAPELVWQVIKTDIPDLKKRITDILKSL